MKKMLGMMVGMLLMSSISEAAEIKFSGDFRVRGIYTDNLYDANSNSSPNDQEAFADGRFRLKIATTVGMTSGVVVVDFTDSFADPHNPECATTGCGTGNYRFGTANFGGDYGIVGVREAHLKLDFGDTKLAFGRKQFVLGHSLVLDDTMDAIAGKMVSGPFHIMLATGKLRERSRSGTPGSTGSDADLYIAKVGYAHAHDMKEPSKEASAESQDGHRVGLFVAYLNDREPDLIPASDHTTLLAGGFTTDGRFGGVDLNFEIDVFSGKREFSAAPDIDLTGMNLLFGGKVDAGQGGKVGLTFLHTRGDEDKRDENNINGLSGNYVLGNILINDDLSGSQDGMCPSPNGVRIGSGARGCALGTGITAVKLAIDLPEMANKNCDGELAVIWAKATERPVIPGLEVDRNLGVELDANATHRLDDNVSLALNLGYLFAGDFFEFGGANPGADNIFKAVASIRYIF